MKKNIALVFTFIFAGAAFVFCQVKYDAKTWRNVQTYDVSTLTKNVSGHVRQLVAVKCNFRGKDIHHMQPNWYESSVWQSDPDKKGKFTDIRVMVAKKDLKAFKSLPTDSTAGEMTLYGRVEQDLRANFVFLRLVGRNAVVDAAGNATVTW
jgi:hypothetical protein